MQSIKFSKHNLQKNINDESLIRSVDKLRAERGYKRGTVSLNLHLWAADQLMRQAEEIAATTRKSTLQALLAVQKMSKNKHLTRLVLFERSTRDSECDLVLEE